MSRAGAAERGFTLIELLVVLTIAALLTAVALPRVVRATSLVSRDSDGTPFTTSKRICRHSAAMPFIEALA